MGEGARRRVGARALSRGSHLELREQRNDYTKDGTLGNKDIKPRAHGAHTFRRAQVLALTNQAEKPKPTPQFPK